MRELKIGVLKFNVSEVNLLWWSWYGKNQGQIGPKEPFL